MRAFLIAGLLGFMVAPSALGEGWQTPPAGRVVEGLSCAADETQTYALYLPTDYDPEKTWPLLLVFDPRGRSVLAAELFKEAAQEYGWIIVSSNDTRSDESMEANQRAVNALWPEIQTRYSVDLRRIYAAGFSGTVQTGILLGKATDGLAGVIGVGGRYFPEILEGVDFAVFGAVGTTDYNNREMRKLHRHLAEQGAPNRLVMFDGGHTWMPPELAGDCVAWMELQAMKTGVEARNAAFVERRYQKAIAEAEELATDGQVLEAQRTYQAIALDFDGLVDVTVATRIADELAAEPDFRKARKTEKKLDHREARFVEEMQRVMESFLTTEPAVPPDRLAAQLRVEEMKRQVSRGGEEGLAAERMLSALFSTTSFYMTRDLLAGDRPDHAASVLGVACLIHDDRPVVWYNRACALARAGRRSKALDALSTAVDLGFTNAGLMASDPDLESIRDEDRVKAVIRRVESP